jgi:hypothetical protein
VALQHKKGREPVREFSLRSTILSTEAATTDLAAAREEGRCSRAHMRPAQVVQRKFATGLAPSWCHIDLVQCISRENSIMLA